MHRPSYFAHCASRCVLRHSLCAAVSLCSLKATGQVIQTPNPSGSPGATTTPLAAGTSQLAPLPPASTSGSPGVQDMLLWGPFRFHPHLTYSLVYADGLHGQLNQTSKTVINTLSPGVMVELGSHWTLDYTPSLRFYSDPHFRDTVDHSVGLSGRTSYKDWTLGLSQNYARTSQPLVETGSQTDQEFYSTALAATYSVNSAMSLELGAGQNFRFVDQSQSVLALQDVRGWSTMDWLNYKVWQKLSLGVGVGLGYDDLSVGSDTLSEQLQGRIVWRATDKLNLSVSGGVDDRQFLHSGVSDLVNPIFGASIQYQPFEVTAFSFSASRSVSPSYFQSEITESTILSVGLRQRLLGKLFLDVGGSYHLSDYDSTATGLAVHREDSGTSVNVTLSTQLLKRATASVFWSRSENSSTESGFSYSSMQVGLQLGYRF